MNAENGSRHILVVDDEPSIRLGCKKLLSTDGFQVDTAEDGLSGLKLVKQKAYDLVLVDLKMPGIDGLQFLVETGRLDPDLVCIVITGYASIETAVEAVKRGAYDYIPKPFTADELRSVVGRGLEKRALSLEARRLREEQKRNLLLIAQERGRLRTVLNCMKDAVLVTNKEGLLALYNPAATKFLRFHDEEGLVGKPLSQCTVCEDLAGLASQALEDRKYSMVSREIALEDEGTTFMANAAPVFSDSDECIGLVIVLRDITKLKQLEEMKSRFVSMVSHELKAPIAAIEGYLDLILSGIIPESNERKRLEVLERCKQRAEGCLKLLGDLLELSRMERGNARNLEKVDIPSVLQEVAELMQMEADRRSVTLVVETPSELPPVVADRDEMVRLYTNLVSNAIKYNNNGGRVIVKAEESPGHIKTQVTDTGIGIPSEELPHIFEEFHRVKNRKTRQTPGTGLGLAIVKRIVEAHNGKLQIESTPGVGTTVTVYIPKEHRLNNDDSERDDSKRSGNREADQL